MILIVEFHFNRVRVLHSTFVKERKTQTAMAQSKVLEKNLRILVEKLKTSHQSVLVAMKTMRLHMKYCVTFIASKTETHILKKEDGYKN